MNPLEVVEIYNGFIKAFVQSLQSLGIKEF